LSREAGFSISFQETAATTKAAGTDTIRCKSPDLTLRTTSDLSVHRTAAMIGEADRLSSMTAPTPAGHGAAAGGGRETIIDQSGPLATLAAKR